MPRRIDYRELEPAERRAAMMRVSGLSLAAIGQFLDVDYVTVSAILKRPRVARFMLALESTMVDNIDKEHVQSLNEAIEDQAHRAFEIEVDVMERLYRREYDVRAQLGAASTAQDILDRAGKRAPQQARVQVDYGIPAHALAAAVEALREHERVIDVSPPRLEHEGARNGTASSRPGGSEPEDGLPMGSSNDEAHGRDTGGRRLTTADVPIAEPGWERPSVPGSGPAGMATGERSGVGEACE